MRNLGLFLMMLVPLLVNAENFPAGNQQQLQVMMQQAEQIQKCMKNVDPTKIQTLQQKAEKLATEVKALCAAGKRSQALIKAKSYSQEVLTDPSIQALNNCGAMLKGLVSGLLELAEPYMNENSSVHICDQ